MISKTPALPNCKTRFMVYNWGGGKCLSSKGHDIRNVRYEISRMIKKMGIHPWKYTFRRIFCLVMYEIFIKMLAYEREGGWVYYGWGWGEITRRTSVMSRNIYSGDAWNQPATAWREMTKLDESVIASEAHAWWVTSKVKIKQKRTRALWDRKNLTPSSGGILLRNLLLKASMRAYV